MDECKAMTELPPGVESAKGLASGYQWVAALVLVVGVVIFDQITKKWMVELLSGRGSVPVIAGYFDLTLVFNRGAAFGLFGGITNDTLRYAVLGLCTLLAFVVVVMTLIYDLRHSLMGHLAIGLVVGGAIGNLIDRVRHGVVVDFLDFYIGTWHWPAFNVADIAISIGVGLLILLQVLPRPKDPQAGVVGSS